LQSAGLKVVRRQVLIQPMDFNEWMAAAGATDKCEQATALLFGPNGEDVTGLAPNGDGESMTIHHHTLILVAMAERR